MNPIFDPKIEPVAVAKALIHICIDECYGFTDPIYYHGRDSARTLRYYQANANIDMGVYGEHMDALAKEIEMLRWNAEVTAAKLEKRAKQLGLQP